MTRFEKWLLFSLTTLVVSPLYFHLDYWFIFRDSHSFFEAITWSMISGSLFFFSIATAVASFCEIICTDLLVKDKISRALLFLCPIPLLALLFEWFQVHFNARDPDNLYFIIQGGTAILAFLVAVVIKARFYFLERTN